MRRRRLAAIVHTVATIPVLPIAPSQFAASLGAFNVPFGKRFYHRHPQDVQSLTACIKTK